ncbi:regulator of chromosome condensation 1/beta-lactamase-inhibitor protein II [Baffinella frigidus]|nr:regulator of chromosome condensation 1/beta-lactamase-inhibitor protein II [Cryptophyta sp. CCMP2293]
MKFKEAVAAATAVDVTQVTITGITDSSEGRRLLLAASIEVEFRAEGARQASLDVATLSVELNTRGLPAATASTTAATAATTASSTPSSADTSCPIGSYTEDGGSCNLCEVGSYSEDEDSVACTSCGQGATTSVAGSTDRDDCICAAGYSSWDCEPCAAGSYKDALGRAACTTCGNVLTSSAGSTAVSNCLCPAGYAGDASGEEGCTICPAGSYKDGLGPAACTICSNSATSAAGSASVSDCICAAGVTGSGGYNCTAAVFALGHTNSCIRNAALSLQCWGDNAYGQVGDGSTTTDRHTPVDVALGGTAVAVALGWDHACAVLAGGSLKCWGHNSFGQLGDGTTTDRHKPVNVALGGTAVAVALGYSFSCAILADGSLKCWGYNSHGKLGEGTSPSDGTLNRLTPVDVALGGTAVAVALGASHACAILVHGLEQSRVRVGYWEIQECTAGQRIGGRSWADRTGVRASASGAAWRER